MEELPNEKDDDEMEVSDDDEPAKKKQRNEASNEEKRNLKEENDSLRCQVEAYKNEVSKSENAFIQIKWSKYKNLYNYSCIPSHDLIYSIVKRPFN